MVAVGYQDPVAEIAGDLQAVVGGGLNHSASGKPGGKLTGGGGGNAERPRNFRTGDFPLPQYNLQCPVNAVFVHKLVFPMKNFP